MITRCALVRSLRRSGRSFVSTITAARAVIAEPRVQSIEQTNTIGVGFIDLMELPTISVHCWRLVILLQNWTEIPTVVVTKHF